ncbi:MAG: hypothetical protein A2287_07765 [Candidatus Melainabacteria bacterium RIFOXYA12_FULL_32_12]|nr:MAG: hypothetical protein A2255_02790 [Candidatus Melainabacteria bacterium RIFOXYA2_FULL_32_9]OGI29914.1 MAG: hypothetical protein A2287_07765 [Candidatus Melainabacteria bacterium RIFOXYA12_FULL_32_12]
MHTSNEYDFIFSIGEDCACTGYLRKHNLQNFSYPFDWLTKASFESRIDLLVNDFKDFLNPEDIKFLPKNPELNNDPNYDYYENIRTGFYFYHDFPANSDLLVNLNVVEEKYARRINRLYKHIAEAQTILIVWLSRDKFIDENRLKVAYEKIDSKFPDKNIDFLILENDSNRKPNECECVSVTDNIKKYVYDNASYDYSNPMAECMGNIEQTSKIFDNYKMNVKLKVLIENKIKMVLGKFIALFIPTRSLRRRFKDKWCNL